MSSNSRDDRTEGAADRNAVVESLRDLRGAEAPVIGEAVAAELNRRGINDVTEGHMEFLVDRVRRGDRVAGWGLVRAGFGGLFRTVRDVHDLLESDSQPSWASPPKNVRHVWNTDGTVTRSVFDLATADLEAGKATIAKLLEQVTDQRESEDVESVRPLFCWLATNERNLIDVRFGQFTVGQLSGKDAPKVQAAISVYGGRARAIATDCDLLGAEMSTVHLRVSAPTIES